MPTPVTVITLILMIVGIVIAVLSYNASRDQIHLDEEAARRETVRARIDWLDRRIDETSDAISAWREYQRRTQTSFYANESGAVVFYNETNATESLQRAQDFRDAAAERWSVGDFDHATVLVAHSERQLDYVPPPPPDGNGVGPGGGVPGWVWVVLGLIPLVVVGYLVFSYYQKKKDDGEDGGPR